jgi:hypothetical protein
MATGDASSPPVPEVHVVSRAEQVLGNSALVHVIFGYLVEPRADARDTLSKLAGVSSLWADVAKSDVYWMPIARELFPLWGNNNGASNGAGEGGEATASMPSRAAWQQVGGKTTSLLFHRSFLHFALNASLSRHRHVYSLHGIGTDWLRLLSHLEPRAIVEIPRALHWLDHPPLSPSPSSSSHPLPSSPLVQVTRYGRSVVHRLINIAEWHEGISLSFEIFDECDGLRLFAAQGPIRVLGTTKPGSLALKLIQPKTFHSSPFSAGSRDPQTRFASVTDYFTDGHDPTYPAALNVRVMASDERTGRMALVYASNKVRHAPHTLTISFRVASRKVSLSFAHTAHFLLWLASPSP